MRSLRHVLLVVFIVLFLLLLATIYVIRRPFPRTRGTRQLSGISAEITIKRDNFGIPHIYAENEADLFFAQGYTHAQDRFWQMEFWRHIAAGRLSEIVGPATVETDKFIRNMGWHRAAAKAENYYRAEAPEIYELLEAYSAGVNAWIADNEDTISVNQTVLGLSAGAWEVEPWEPLDSVGWGVVMAWDLRGSDNFDAELQRIEWENSLSAEVTDLLFPSYPDDRPVIVSDRPLDGQSSAKLSPVAVQLEQMEWIGAVPDGGFALGEGAFLGSNNWVVSGEFTESGLPLLADDPHLGVQMPSIWYQVGLHSPEFDVIGMSFAGVPGVVIGRNQNIAWSVTNATADTQDAYIEKLNPDNPKQYEFEGEWRDMTVFEEEILVNGGEPVTLEVLETIHGPLLNTVNDALGQAISVRWTAQEPSRIFHGVLLLNQANNYDEFRHALSHWDTSGQNFVYADVEGNIAYQFTGRYPVRSWEGTRPVPGHTGEFEWDGWIPFEELPALFNPPEGYIVTANHAVVDDSYPYYLTQGWANGNRAQRIEDLLVAEINAERAFSAESFKQMQNDNYQLLYDDLRPHFEELRSDDAQVQEAIERLRGWDGQLTTDSVPAAIFEVFQWQLETQIVADETGDLAESVAWGNTVLLRQIVADEEHLLWDDVMTEGREDSAEIILRALENSVRWLTDNHGRNSRNWQWGNIHTITFSSNPLGLSGIAPVERLVNRGAFPVSGGRAIVNANGHGWGDNFGEVFSHPSMRMIIDLSDADAGFAIHATGQSGHPMHRHYSDMTPLWLDGEYHPFVFSAEAVDQLTTRTLTLQPD